MTLSRKLSPVCVSQYQHSSSSSIKSVSNAPKRKCVKFADDKNLIYNVEHIKDFTKSLVAAIWYDADDYADIKKEYHSTVFDIESGIPLDSDTDTSRGLENRTKQGAWARYENKRDAYNAVLDEQDRQWKRNLDSLEAIASAYRKISAICAKAASDRGLQDARDAKQ